MGENIVLLIIIASLAGAVVSVVVYYLLRFLRGKIQITLPVISFAPGDMVKGSLILSTKKPLQGNKLVVRLNATRVSKSYRNGKRHTSKQVIFKNETIIEQPKQYPAGYNRKYNFQIPVPYLNAGIQELNGTMGTLMKALSSVSNMNSRIDWKVEARLDAKGVDLSKSKKIFVNMQM